MNTTTMTAERIITEFTQLGIQLEAHGDRIKYIAPPGTMTPDRLGLLREHKHELLVILGARGGGTGTITPQIQQKTEVSVPGPVDRIAALRVLRDLHDAGVVVSLDGDDLNLTGPDGVVDADLADLLRPHKPALVAHLRRHPWPRLVDLSPDQQDDFEERAAIREHDGNLPRELAEALALVDVAMSHHLAHGEGGA